MQLHVHLSIDKGTVLSKQHFEAMDFIPKLEGKKCDIVLVHILTAAYNYNLPNTLKSQIRAAVCQGNFLSFSCVAKFLSPVMRKHMSGNFHHISVILFTTYYLTIPCKHTRACHALIASTYLWSLCFIFSSTLIVHVRLMAYTLHLFHNDILSDSAIQTRPTFSKSCEWNFYTLRDSFSIIKNKCWSNTDNIMVFMMYHRKFSSRFGFVNFILNIWGSWV